MTRWIGLLAVALPFLEIAGFVWIGGKLGVALTLLWVLAAMVGGLLLPVILILMGPLLVVAALRGRQRIGPITLDAARSSARRTGALVVGLLLWLLALWVLDSRRRRRQGRPRAEAWRCRSRSIS